MPRPVINYRTASKENYQIFCEKNPSIDITFVQYKKIIYTYNNLIVQYVLETGEMIKFPYGLGCLVINKYKPKMYRTDKEGVEHVNLSIDWKETRKAGKYVYLFNSHTDGFKYYFMWNHWRARIRHACIWKFEMARVHSRSLKSYLKKTNSIYKDLYKSYERKR